MEKLVWKKEKGFVKLYYAIKLVILGLVLFLTAFKIMRTAK